MRKLTTNLIKTILAPFLALFYVLFSILIDVLKFGGEMFDEIINKLKNY